MTCLVIIAGYEVVAIWLKPTPSEILVSNNFFLLASMVIGMVAGYVIERGARTAFEQRELIDAQRIELAARNAHLDSELRRTLLEVERQADDLGLKAFAIAIIAGLAAPRGILICGLLYGAFEGLVSGYLYTGIRDILGFSIMIIALFLRPEGLFGVRQEERA